MLRTVREKCENSIYHIMVRGNNQQDIFFDENDRFQYLKRLKRYKERYKIEVYAYCLMTNHVHLLIYDNGQDISKVMQGLNLSYAIYFNKKYDRCGHLFQDRFKSIRVKRDSYLIEVSKYIHHNPVTANMVNVPGHYKWSSMGAYLGCRDFDGIVDNRCILAYFSEDYQESINLYFQYMEDKEIEETVAATIESGHSGIRNQDAFKVTNSEQIIQSLADHFNIHRLHLLRKNNRIYQNQRDILIYIVALKSKASYKKMAEIFYVKPPSIGASIRRTIQAMIDDSLVCEEVESLLKTII